MEHNFESQGAAFASPSMNVSLGLNIASMQHVQQAEEEHAARAHRNTPSSLARHIDHHGSGGEHVFPLAGSFDMNAQSVHTLNSANHSDPMQSPEFFSLAFASSRGNARGTPPTKTTFLPADGIDRHSRTGTIRRFDSFHSIASAPPDLGEELDSSFVASSPEYSESFLRSPSSRVSAFGSPMLDSPTSMTSSSAIPQARKRRNKCSPEQYRHLEAFFAKNRNPTGKVREELSKRIQMPERSVQVWFQNKRAKTKVNEIKEGIPPEQRTTVSRPSKLSRALSSCDTGGRKRKPGPEDTTKDQQESILQLPCSSLCVGDWRRIKPLICLFSRRNQAFTWYLSSESVGFKLECPRSCVTKISFSGPTEPLMHEVSEGINGLLGHLIIELSRPPQFYMEVFRSSGRDAEQQSNGVRKASWRQCTDFTEGKQATSTLRHVVSGPYNLLRHAIKQLHETTASISDIIEFDDQGYTEHELLQHEHQYQYQNAAYLSLHQDQGYPVEPRSSHMSESCTGLLSADGRLAFPSMEGQESNAIPAVSGSASGSQSSTSWSPPHLSGGSDKSVLSDLSSPHHLPTVGIAPNVASGLDFSGLRIDFTGMSGTPYEQQYQQQRRYHQLAEKPPALHWSHGGHNQQYAPALWGMDNVPMLPYSSAPASPQHFQRSLHAQEQEHQHQHQHQLQMEFGHRFDDMSETPTHASFSQAALSARQADAAGV